jgi:predicted aldo/keto reductase-like oxidoreductase
LAYAKGGVLEAFDQAKKEGKVRFVGFTGHKDPAFHLKMLELGYPFDSVQMPLNPFDANFHSCPDSQRLTRSRSRVLRVPASILLRGRPERQPRNKLA